MSIDLPSSQLPEALDGLLAVHKRQGITSRDVVNLVQRVVKPIKVGHAGTLDPLATGLLVICVGKATRLVDYIHRFTKRYRGTFQLGLSSDTEDITGHVVPVQGNVPSTAELQAVIPQFLGASWQQPPIFSALKVAGERAYDRAREGKQVTLQPRQIVVERMEVLSYDYPNLELEIVCGSGTYIRSLGRDLARAVGTEAVMTGLRREQIGPFELSQAVLSTDPASPPTRTEIARQLLSPRLALQGLPSFEVTSEKAMQLAQGQFLFVQYGGSELEALALDQNGRLLAVLKRSDPQATRWQPSINCMAR